jgi:hypothetical protein
MERRLPRRRRRAVGAGVVLLGLVTGCCHDKCCCKDPVVIPPPTGTHTHEIFDLQAQKAEADDFVIYKNEWFNAGTKLGPYGDYHLDQIAKRLPTVPFPVVIQPEADPGLNQARLEVIITCLANKEIPDADHRVIIAYPQAEGLFGECEAESAFLRMLHPPRVGTPYAGGLYGGFYGGGLTGYGGFSRLWGF